MMDLKKNLNKEFKIHDRTIIKNFNVNNVQIFVCSFFPYVSKFKDKLGSVR